jgi:hypothetical protein
VALSLQTSSTTQRLALLFFSPVLPLLIMDFLWVAVVARLLFNSSAQAGITLALFLPSTFSHILDALKRTWVVWQLYAAPAVGALVSLAAFSWLGAAPSASSREEFNRALIGVAAGTALFTVSYAVSRSKS